VIDKRKHLFTGLQLLSQCIEHGKTNLRIVLSTSEALLSVQLKPKADAARRILGEACFSRLKNREALARMIARSQVLINFFFENLVLILFLPLIKKKTVTIATIFMTNS
jgi:hypothetical protein